MPSQPLLDCLDQLEKYGFGPEFQSYFMREKPRLLGNDDVARDLVILAAQEDDAENAVQLLGLLLDEVRIGLENDGDFAVGFMTAVESAVLAGIATELFGQEDLMLFAGLYRQAGLPVPPSLTLDPETMVPPPDMESFDLAENLEEIARDVIKQGGSAHDLFSAIDMMLAAAPEEVQATLANHMATMQAPFFERCALFMLLSGSETVQQATIAGLMERLGALGLSAQTLKLLTMIRGWFAAGSVQAGLDALIRKTRKATLPGPTGTAPAKIQQIIASIADGVGAQSIAVTLKQGRKIQMTMILIKTGHGIKDSFSIAAENKRDAKNVVAQLRQQTGADVISENTLRVLLEWALADGLENGQLPAPGFLDVVETCDLYDLRPQELGLDALFQLADPERVIQGASPQSLDCWMNDEDALNLLAHLSYSWFEDTGETREIVASERTLSDTETKLRKFVETRRELWARRFLQTAVMLRDSNRLREWKCLTATAHGLLNERSLKHIPLMEDVVDATIEAADMMTL